MLPSAALIQVQVSLHAHCRLPNSLVVLCQNQLPPGLLKSTKHHNISREAEALAISPPRFTTLPSPQPVKHAAAAARTKAAIQEHPVDTLTWFARGPGPSRRLTTKFPRFCDILVFSPSQLRAWLGNSICSSACKLVLPLPPSMPIQQTPSIHLATIQLIFFYTTKQKQLPNVFGCFGSPSPKKKRGHNPRNSPINHVRQTCSRAREPPIPSHPYYFMHDAHDGLRPIASPSLSFLRQPAHGKHLPPSCLSFALGGLA